MHFSSTAWEPAVIRRCQKKLHHQQEANEVWVATQYRDVRETYMRCHYLEPLVTVNEMVEAYQSVLSKHGLYMTNGESYFKLI